MTRKLTRSLIVALMVAMLAVAGALVKPPGASARTTQTKINWNDPVQAINAFIPSINSYWNAVFVNYPRSYRAPGHIYWYGFDNQAGQHVTADCGGYELEDMNAFYCDDDTNIYLGYPLLLQQLQQYGPYASVAILAHEWGHEAQAQLGWFDYAAQRNYWKGTELQADCYAGMYTRWAYDHTWLNAGNVSNAQMATYGIGHDDDLDPYAAGSHGTKAERLYWFNVGFNTQNLTSCNNVYKAVYGG